MWWLFGVGRESERAGPRGRRPALDRRDFGSEVAKISVAVASAAMRPPGKERRRVDPGGSTRRRDADPAG
jgi:hypothetical protein